VPSQPSLVHRARGRNIDHQSSAGGWFGVARETAYTRSCRSSAEFLLFRCSTRAPSSRVPVGAVRQKNGRWRRQAGSPTQAVTSASAPPDRSAGRSPCRSALLCSPGGPDRERRAHRGRVAVPADAERGGRVPAHPGGHPALLAASRDRLAELERDIAATRQELTDARARIATLKAERLAIPTAEAALQTQPEDRLTQEHDAWRARRDTAQRAARTASRQHVGSDRTARLPRPEDLHYLQHRPGPGRGIGR